MRTHTPLATAAPLLLLLAGCTAAPAAPPEDETYVSAPETPDAAPAAEAPGAVEADTTLIVRTTATAANGAQLALEMRVHQPIVFDDIANQTLPGAFVESCGATYNADLFAAEAWSFARANISAVPTAASTSEWPLGSAIVVVPTPGSMPIVGRGMLREDPAALAPCLDAKSFAMQGNGAIAFGIAGDSGTFRGWVSHRYGFSAASGVTFSECTFELTAVGGQFGGGEGWSSVADVSDCSIGASS
jgi:hypothetical protein